MYAYVPLALGLTVRIRDGRLAILLQKPFVVCAGQLQMLSGPAILEISAVCTICQSSTWFWERDLLPVCRTCHPPSADWQYNLLSRAMAAMTQLDPELVGVGKAQMEEAFVKGDTDALQIIEGLYLVQQVLRKNYRKYFEKVRP